MRRIWLRRGILSNRDIERLLGKEIFIYPFEEQNLKGSTYNLTASPCAYIIDNQDKKQKIIVNDKNEIVIPKHRAALIETRESIYVSNKICGTYHSKVGLVKKGLSHIGTTLDPEYFGTSLIAIHNNTEHDEYITVGKSFVSLMLYGMRTRSDAPHDNQPFRSDLIDINAVDFYEENWQEKRDKKQYNKKKQNNKKQDNKKENRMGQDDKKLKSKEDIRNDIVEWRDAPYRQSLKGLQKEVYSYVRNRDKAKHITWTIVIGVVASVIIEVGLIWGVKVIDYSKNEGICLGIIALIATVIPTAGIIVKMVINYINDEK